MNHLTPEEIAEFREIFNLVDKDKGGSINKSELADLIDTLGIDASPEDIDQMVAEIDSDGNGEINFEEFVAVMSRKVNAAYTPDEVKNAFRVFQGDCPQGQVDPKKLINAMCTYGTEKLSFDQARDLVNLLDRNPNGLINYIDYVNMMMGS